MEPQKIAYRVYLSYGLFRETDIVLSAKCIEVQSERHAGV